MIKCHTEQAHQLDYISIKDSEKVSLTIPLSSSFLRIIVYSTNEKNTSIMQASNHTFYQEKNKKLAT